MFYDCAAQQKFPVPLLAVIFLTAMKVCRSKVCLELENELQRKTEAQALPREGMDGCSKAQSKAFSLPPQEAEKSLEKHMKEMIAPVIAEDTQSRPSKKLRCPEASGSAQGPIRTRKPNQHKKAAGRSMQH